MATGTKKSKNPKPKLKSMSIGDIIGDTKKKKGHSTTNMQQTAIFKMQENPQVDSVQEFPALGTAPAASTAKPAPKVIWGVQQKPPQQAKIAKPSSISAATNKPSSSSSNNANNNKKKKNKKAKTNNAVLQPTPSSSSFFQPLARTSILQHYREEEVDPRRQLEGEEHQLLRLMQKGNVYEKKGRQRLIPRKKKFTALKKKVLQERLDQWRALHPKDDDDGNQATTAGSVSRLVCIYQYTTAEEVEDDDEYQEILDNLKSMATKIGPVEDLLIPRGKEVHDKEEGDDDEFEELYPVFVQFEKASDAAAAQACWNDLQVGGTKLRVVTLMNAVDLSKDDTPAWSEQVVQAELDLRRNAKTAAVAETIMSPASTNIFLQKVLTEDDYVDEDCMEESLQDLKKVAEQHGELEDIRASEEKDGNVVLTYHCCDMDKARVIAQNLCRAVVAGKPLYAFVKEDVPNQTNQLESTILLDNILTEDDLDDEDCLGETLSDIRELCGRYGEVSNIVAKGKGVKVTYNGDASVGEHAVRELDGMILGGNVVAASLVADASGHVILHNALTEDDLEDEDCLEESLNDIRQLASKYGLVDNLEVLRVDQTASIRIRYNGAAEVAEFAAKNLNGSIIGGQICTATHEGGDRSLSESNTKNESSEGILGDEVSGDKRKSSDESSSDKKARMDDKESLYSGDKLIPERFAEMKRVPKVPNAPGPRGYANTVPDERVKPLLVEMLGELMRLQKRAMEENNTKARRRIVMGLREVARGIRANKGMCGILGFVDFLESNLLRNCSLFYRISQNGCHGQQSRSVRSN